MKRMALLLLTAATLGAHTAGAAAARRGADAPAGTCSWDTLLDDARVGLERGSPALKRYLRALLQEAALNTPDDVLLRALARAGDAALLEALGAAVARKAETVERPELIVVLLGRAAHDDDPALRAAAVRALRGTGSVELMRQSGADIDYRTLVRDASTEVRDAVVDNLVAEDDEVYSGHSQTFAEEALAVAQQTPDATAAARLVAETSTEALGQDTARWLARTLSDDEPALRQAAARALGGVAPEHAAEARSALVARYLLTDDLELRRAILASLARLERARGIALLESLRSVDARLVNDIDAWIAVLARGLPEWALILREKDRL